MRTLLFQRKKQCRKAIKIVEIRKIYTNKDGKINFSLLKGIGNCNIDNFFSPDEL